MSTPLTEEASRRVALLFPPEDREAASNILVNECGNSLPFCADSKPKDLDRIRFAALKLSDGHLGKLTKVVDLAKLDWRDLLVAAGFADDIHAHEKWLR